MHVSLPSFRPAGHTAVVRVSALSAGVRLSEGFLPSRQPSSNHLVVYAHACSTHGHI